MSFKLITLKSFFSSVQSLSRVRLFVTPWIAARQASLSITISWSSLKLMSIELWCHPAISSPVDPFSSCSQSLPASESFPMSQLFSWGGQSTGISALASFLPKKSQGWSPSEWTGWISLQSKGLSRVLLKTGSSQTYIWIPYMVFNLFTLVLYFFQLIWKIVLKFIQKVLTLFKSVKPNV